MKIKLHFELNVLLFINIVPRINNDQIFSLLIMLIDSTGYKFKSFRDYELKTSIVTKFSSSITMLMSTHPSPLTFAILFIYTTNEILRTFV